MPGQPGTKKLSKEYGDRLVCIRYRSDEKNNKRIKTNEIIIDEHDLESTNRAVPRNKMVHLHINYGEIHLGRLVRAAGGRWNKEKKVWELPYGEVLALGLEERIIDR